MAKLHLASQRFGEIQLIVLTPLVTATTVLIRIAKAEEKTEAELL